MKVAIIGGHLTPALAVLEALPKDTEVLFIGRKYALEGDKALSLEYKTISSSNIPFAHLNTGRLQRKFTRFAFSSLFKSTSGFVKAFSILTKFKPDVVMSFGGYVSVPVVLSAAMLKIPVVIHEQTMGAGLANKIASGLAEKVCISWESSREYFPKNKIILTGNPIRKFSSLTSQFSTPKNNLPVIYVTGGSSGAHFINTLIEGIIRELLKTHMVIHQTGDAREYCDFERLSSLKESLPADIRENYLLEKFIDPFRVGNLIELASIIISRAGVNTVNEIASFKKPAILIPLPFSQNNEQLKNAEFLEKIGLGVVLRQSELSGKKLLQTISQMSHNIDKYKINSREFENLGIKDPAQKIVDVISYVYRSKKAKKS